MQIWWKGDPGVENFMIKFQNEEMMKKWAAGLDQQRKENAAPAQQTTEQSVPNFAWIASQSNGMENPYAEPDDDDDDPYASTLVGSTPPSQYGSVPSVPLPGTMQRNGSSTSLRQRSMTGESAQSLAGLARAPPPRFPLPQPPQPLSVQTQMGMTQPSPAPRGGESYFSPVAESPASSRTSTTSGFFSANSGYTFPKSATPQSTWGPEDSNRYTAPAMPRAPSRDGPSPANAYGMVPSNGRNPRGPSMPVMPRDSAQMQLQRSRSYSTPDINGQPNGRNGQPVPAVPGIPPHLHATHVRHDSNIPRSNTGSPANDLPLRTNTSSPGTQRSKQYGGTMAQFPSQPIYPRQGTPGSGMNLPPPGPPPQGIPPLAPIDAPRSVPMDPIVPPTPDIVPLPTQLKVKVNCDGGNYVTLVVQFNITYQSLIDRIDAKLARFTNSGIGKGNLKLRYRDEDGDLIMIESDDDIQIAISEWREGARNMYSQGVGEIELFCLGV